MKLILTILLIGTKLIALSQVDDMKGFTYLKSSGDIPQEFITLTADKYKEDLQSNNNKDLDKDFFLSTRFFIDELLLSGKVLFNEELSGYVNKVAKYVLRKDKKLYNSLQFYVLKSNTVNAFSTDQGIIFVTTGLLAQLENEAQLGYILAHEIAHFTEEHAKEGYVERQNIIKGKGKYDRLSYEDRVGELSVYSKDNELEADEVGIKIFLDSEYDIETVFTSFEVLLYSYLPFEDIQFDTTFFNTDVLYIPGGLFPDTVRQVSKTEDFDDNLSTHPNIKKRMDSAFEAIGDSETKGSLKFKFPEVEFYNVRNLARFESINLHLSNRQYVKAIYNIFLLKRKFKDNKFLDFSLVKALYGLAKYKNHQRYNEVILKLKKVEGELYKIAFFLKKIEKGQINVLAYRFAYDLSVKYKNDPLIKKYERDMLKEFALYSSIDHKDLIAINYEKYNDSLANLINSFDIQDSIAKIDASELSKYKKIKLKKRLRELESKGGSQITEEQFHLTGLSDLVSRGEFQDEIDFFIAEKELEEEKDLAKESEKKGKEVGLGIDKIVVVDPYFADYKTNNDKNDVKSEKQKIQLNKMYSKNYNKLNLETYLVDSKTLTQKDVEKYNEMGLLYQWVGEILEHDEITMISSSNEYVQEVKEKYNTEHFLFSGIIKYKERNEFTMMHLYGIIFFYTAPIAIADLLVIHNYFELFAISINSETDQIEYSKTENVNLNVNNLIMEAYIYNILYNLNKTKDVEKK
jgi:hypothetical protein